MLNSHKPTVEPMEFLRNREEAYVEIRVMRGDGDIGAVYLKDERQLEVMAKYLHEELRLGKIRYMLVLPIAAGTQEIADMANAVTASVSMETVKDRIWVVLNRAQIYPSETRH